MAMKVVVTRTTGSQLHKYFHGDDAEADARAYAAKVSTDNGIRSAVLVRLPEMPWTERPTWRAPW